MLSIRESLVIRVTLGSVVVLLVALGLWNYSPSLAAETTSVYLPVVLRNFPPPPTVFGAEVKTFTDEAFIQLAVEARLSWVRIPAFLWDEIEPNAPLNGEHTYDWSKVPESSLLNIASNHMYAIATVKMTPSWAQKYSGVSCGPIAQENFTDFAAFLQAAVERYSQPPYNIHYWELGNEVDVSRTLVPPDYPFGCWGEEDDAYYGGSYYADMLKVAYPAIKAADPQAQVLIGGLLLDCDPADPDCNSPNAAKFFEGILLNGGDSFFDVVSYHAYPAYADPSDPLFFDEHHPEWDLRGGIQMGKIQFLREVMATYGVDKPMMLTESGLMCIESSPYCQPLGDEFLDSQSDYVVWLFVRSWAEGLQGAVWYTFDGAGWRGVGLVGDDPSNPRPAYRVFKFLTRELQGMDYTGQPVIPDELRGYVFSDSEKDVWILWSPDGVERNVTLPTGVTNIWDKLGNSVTISDNVLPVLHPVYVEFSK